MTRTYSVAEIKRMRQAVRVLMSRDGFYYADLNSSEVEAQLQTYMLNGTSPEELAAAADEHLREQEAEQMRMMQAVARS